MEKKQGGGMVKSWGLGEDAALQVLQRSKGDTRRQSKSSLEIYPCRANPCTNYSR